MFMKSSFKPKPKLKNNLEPEHKVFVTKHYILFFPLKNFTNLIYFVTAFSIPKLLQGENSMHTSKS